MAPRISQAILIVSGAVTGLAAIAAIHYYNNLDRDNQEASQPNRSATLESAIASRSGNGNEGNTRTAGRLRRTRSIRRRNRNAVRRRSSSPTPVPTADSPSNSNVNNNSTSIADFLLSDTEEELDNRRMLSLFKEWSDDDNKNLLNLLHAISENQSRKEGFIHRGITCNKCNMSPIRGVRYKCANCVDFDLCEMCEGSNTHTPTHVFLKIRVPIPPLANPRSALLSPFYPGKQGKSSAILPPILPSDRYEKLQQNSHFDQVELEALYEQYKSLSTVDREEGGIDRETFKQCLGPLGLEKSLVTERIFAFFDQDKDQVISFDELVAGLSVLCKGNLDEKIECAFKGYDLDEDGYISKDELYRMYKSYFYLSMELVRDVVSAMEDEMMDSFEFSASQPVSAAFNVAMPSSSLPRSRQQHPSSDTSSDDHDSTSSSGASESDNDSSNSSDDTDETSDSEEEEEDIEEKQEESSENSSSGGSDTEDDSENTSSSNSDSDEEQQEAEDDEAVTSIQQLMVEQSSSSSARSVHEPANRRKQPHRPQRRDKKARYPLKEDYFLQQQNREAEKAKALSLVSSEELNDIADGVLRADNQHILMLSSGSSEEKTTAPKSDKGKGKSSFNSSDSSSGSSSGFGNRSYEERNTDKIIEDSLQKAEVPSKKKAWEEKFPIMETMSRGAIQEMVDKTFDNIKTEREGYINFKEFKECVQQDSSIVSWFEALGTVF